MIHLKSSTDDTNRALAEGDCAQLCASERGRGALMALHTLLSNDATYSLDWENQAALSNLLQRALITPSVREIIAARCGRLAQG